MRQTTIISAMVMTVLASIATVGCNDELKAKDAHIAVIEDSNQRLTSELLAARRDNDALMTERGELDGQVMAFRGEIDDLRGQLNNRFVTSTVFYKPLVATRVVRNLVDVANLLFFGESQIGRVGGGL